MKTYLMYRDRDFNLKQKLPSNESALTQDLELNTLFNAMAGDDELLFDVAKQAVLSGFENDAETILYRQAILKDCLRNESIVKNLYEIAVLAIEGKRKQWLGIFGVYPSGILHGATKLLQMFMARLNELRLIAHEQGDQFESEGFGTFFSMLKTELADDYFNSVNDHLKEVQFRDGVLLSAELGHGNKGSNYVLRKSQRPQPGWLQRLFLHDSSAFTFSIDPRDEAGCRALSDLQNQGINLVANALAQSADHILNFFIMLRTELAFYIGCMNLHGQLEQKKTPICFPIPTPPGASKHTCNALRDACLVLSLDRDIVGNDLNANEKNLFIITGANQGGKSTFLRSIGLAQMMMQCGMFVNAQSFSTDICRSLFTHYKREEDTTMTSGKFDEELARMDEISNSLTTNSMILFNESFAATNEREGSEIAAQIVHALLEAGVKIFFVTHLYQFANDLYEEKMSNALFLRAERQDDGGRTFKLIAGEPLQTSFGIDLYNEIFGTKSKDGG